MFPGKPDRSRRQENQPVRIWTGMSGWRVCLSGVVLLLLVMLLVVPLPVDRTSRLTESLWNFMHFPAFALWAWVMLKHVWGRVPPPRNRLYALGAVLLAAPLIEGLQAMTGREPDLGDVVMGWAGGLAVVLCDAARAREGLTRFAPVLSALLLTAYALAPVSLVLADRWAATRSFPMLSAFHSERETGRWRVNDGELERVRKYATHGAYSLRVILKDGVRYPGVFMIDFPSDWHGAQQLVLDVYLVADSPVDFWFRVDDQVDPAYAERVQRQVSIEPGRNELSFDVTGWITPSGRALDTRNIDRWGLFVEEPDEDVELYVDRVRLEF